MKIVIITLGCKVNQYESDALAEKLSAVGHNVFFKLQNADIYILNSCAVTNEAERKSRQYVSKFLKFNPNAKIFVMGCASQKNPDQFWNLPNVKYVVGNVNKLNLLEKIEKLDRKRKLQPLPNFYENISISKSSHTRAYVKIQDGCNRFCSYCLIPYLRGRSRSRDIVSILTEVENLKNNGVKEIVLTGIDVSDYRIDDKPALSELMKQLNDYNIRIRLSSMEVSLINDEFLSTLKSMKNFCPHFHLSLQSGCSSVLKRMNRNYTSNEFVNAVKKIRKYFKNVAITTDIIVGFPGETEREFKQTLKTVKRAKFAYIHIFPYSRRSGTVADKLLSSKSNQGFFVVDGNVVKRRVKELSQLNKKMFLKFRQNQIGKKHNVLIEEFVDNCLVGHTENYVKVYILEDVNCCFLKEKENKLLNYSSSKLHNIKSENLSSGEYCEINLHNNSSNLINKIVLVEILDVYLDDGVVGVIKKF